MELVDIILGTAVNSYNLVVDTVLGSVAGVTVLGTAFVQIRKYLEKQEDYRIAKLKCDKEITINRDNNKHALKMTKMNQPKKESSMSKVS